MIVKSEGDEASKATHRQQLLQAGYPYP